MVESEAKASVRFGYAQSLGQPRTLAPGEVVQLLDGRWVEIVSPPRMGEPGPEGGVSRLVVSAQFLDTGGGCVLFADSGVVARLRQYWTLGDVPGFPDASDAADVTNTADLEERKAALVAGTQDPPPFEVVEYERAKKAGRVLLGELTRFRSGRRANPKVLVCRDAKGLKLLVRYQPGGFPWGAPAIRMFWGFRVQWESHPDLVEPQGAA